jgi:hypothetical protein
MLKGSGYSAAPPAHRRPWAVVEIWGVAPSGFEQAREIEGEVLEQRAA